VRALGERSAVERFGDWHDDAGPPSEPGARYARELPASPPRPGTQYRFEVDLDRCSGCKACVSACHSLNGLDQGETWRSVGLLVGGGTEAVPIWQQHVTTACHHCLEPACLAGCPVDAYEKDPVTGIVAHLDDQCIGCRYCMLTCPYEVPSFNARLGVVRKCDMCSDRLSEGEAPACVQGCPTEAISIGVVDTAELAASLAVHDDLRLVPTAPRSVLSSPTTLYRTDRSVPDDAVAADDHRVVPATGHPPLVAMLVLTQVSVGAVVLGEAVSLGAGTSDRPAGPAVVAWLITLVAIAASVLHLGRPGVAWRALLGLRHSWLSREILAFGVYAGIGGAAALAAADLAGGSVADALGVLTAVTGLVGVACSAQLYAVTGRSFWRLDRTAWRFALTMGTGGAAALGAVTAVAAALGATGWRADEVRAAAAVVVCVTTAVGLAGVASFHVRHRGRSGQLGRSEELLGGALRADRRRGILLAVAAAVLGVASLALEPGGVACAGCWVVVTVLAISSSWIERRSFFVAVAPDRMPGALR
jgi:Fe-S-cluster-containing dehydrogenase component/DMSO reductase anchor subunit